MLDVLTASCLIALALVLLGHKSEREALVYLFKPLASACFVALAWMGSGVDSPYGIAVLAALALSFWGDVFLMFKPKRAFLAGLVSFLLGHVAFAVAFVIRGIDPMTSAIGAGVTLVVAIPIARWLLSYVEGGMRGPVMAYIVVISAMAALAIGTWGAHGNLIIPVAAVLFFISDLAVAKQRFVAPSFSNKLWGLPLYYAAQLLFAWTLA
jgi:uncharacterized membrane protein YhhN